MNIFIIPSWYPSIDYPLNGIMIYEQTRALCKMYSNVHVGISIWGQQEEQYLLWAKDHIKNLRKVTAVKLRAKTKQVLPNLKEYHKPTFSWSNKIMNGNMHSIIDANIYNFRAFEEDYGKVDLIHAQVNHPAGRIAMEVAKAMNVPYCITERMSPFPCRFSSDASGKLKKAWLFPYKNSVANITISPAQSSLMQNQGITNIHIIPNFIDEDFFLPAKTQRNDYTFTYLTLTSAIPRKGIDVLLKAIQLYNTTSQNARTIFRIGGIGDVSPYRLLAKELGIEKSIEWFSQTTREETLKEFQSCDAFILPSQEESFGNVYAEATACGKPVIATKCGGPESIVNANNGLLVEVNDASGLAKAISSMVHNYNRYDPELIRQDFLKRFSKKVVLPQLYQLYKEIIEQHRLNR